jgi:hypothetical protein
MAKPQPPTNTPLNIHPLPIITTPIIPILHPPIVSAPPTITLRPSPIVIHPFPITFPPTSTPTPVATTPPQTTFGPAWLYSALAWLAKNYVDASGTTQNFNGYLFGSDVDPYAQLGRTRLFKITLSSGFLVLQYEADLDSIQAASTGTKFPYNDAGILQLYQNLSASSVFAQLKYCYVPCKIGSEVLSGAAALDALSPGYDSTTGIRSVVSGSAVSQVIPLYNFLGTSNEQIYNASPTIVPLVSALVYDVTQNNTLSATSFMLPIFYSRDQVSSGNFYINRLESTMTVSNSSVHCGQTVAFAGGAGFDSTQTTSLTLVSTTINGIVANAQVANTTYNYGTASVTTPFPGAPWTSNGVAASNVAADVGIVSLNYTAASPIVVFSTQRILGFYRKSAWNTSSGVPIYDYGANNASFTTALAANDISDPTVLYDPTLPYLNGGSIPSVIRNYSQAQKPYSQDQLLSVLRGAVATTDTSKGAGVGATTAKLNFNLSSQQSSDVVTELSVPIAATLTTIPPEILIPRIIRPPNDVAFPTTPRTRASFTATSPSVIPVRPIITGGIPFRRPGTPTTVQASLNASVPREALDGTGILSLDTDTPFPAHSLGQGSDFRIIAHGKVLNLTERSDVSPGAPPFDLSLTTAGNNFTNGTFYVLSLTGNTLTVRSPKSSIKVDVGSLAGVNAAYTYVGAMTYQSSTSTTVRLYPKLQLSTTAPAVGTSGVVQGQPYNVRLTFGTATGGSQYDLVDMSQSVLGRGINISTPTPTDGSTPHSGDIYFGSFRGGDVSVVVWLVPVFLSLSASQLPPNTSYNGTMSLTALTNGEPSYQLSITDSSLFIFSNINVDTGIVGSVSSNNNFLASAVINSTPDDQSSKAFAPSSLLVGTVQQVKVQALKQFVFVPAGDSVVIGDVRYMVSIVQLEQLSMDPNARGRSGRPYPPVQWFQTRFWQFANRHNPYRDVQYTGDTEAARTSQAQGDSARIGVQTSKNEEPMHLYLDTNRSDMTLWPIWNFPYPITSPTIDLTQLSNINNIILGILNKPVLKPIQFTSGLLDGERITVPETLQIYNPFTDGAVANPGPATSSSSSSAAASTIPRPILGTPITKLNPLEFTTVLGTPTSLGIRPQTFVEKSPAFAPTTHALDAAPNFVAPLPVSSVNFFQPVIGYSVYNPATGEAYIVELVDNDAGPTGTTYDPYYVRVVFLNKLKCYNMSIIVPSMSHDLSGNLAKQGFNYQNTLSKTNELGLGYMYSLYDSTNNFDNLLFTDVNNPNPSPSQSYLYTNSEYRTQQLVSFNPGHLFGGLQLQLERLTTFNPANIIFSLPPTPPIYFICRRDNAKKECHLMQATNPAGTSVYMSFGGGDIVPLRLNPPVPVQPDPRQPSYMHALSHSISDRQYDSVQTISVANVPYVVGATTQGSLLQFMNFSLGTAPSGSGNVTANQPLQFPTECYIVGQASTTLTSMAAININLNTNAFFDTSQLVNLSGSAKAPEFKLLTYNSLVYMIRLVSNVQALGLVGGVNIISGLLIDTFVPSKTGNLNLAQAARHKRSGLSYFGSSYTPTTMVDSLDNLDFTSITGQTFFSPTIFVPIPEVDASKGFFADLSNFLGQQIWTFVYSEIIAPVGATVNGTSYPNGCNLDQDGKPVLSLQKLHFVYDSLVTLYTPNDLAHKYTLQAKQRILAVSNGQIIEGVCWRSSNPQASGAAAPQNICAQQILPAGPNMDRQNIVYLSHNRPVTSVSSTAYMGMSVKSIISVSGVAYSVEESALATDQVGSRLVSTVSSVTNLLIAMLFDYDNDDLGTMTSTTYSSDKSTKGIVLLSGYSSANGYDFSSPDHFDVNDVLPSQVPFLEQVSEAMGAGWDMSFYNVDISVPRQFWSMAYDALTAPGLPNFISNVPPSQADPGFTNRTRSLILSLENVVRPVQLGLMDTYSSVVSVNLRLQNGITGSVFLNKKSERDMVQIGLGAGANNVAGWLPANYDFYIFSRDHYGTLSGGTFDIIDHGYAMCLVDDGSGTGNSVAQFFIDADGNYYELYSYLLSTPNSGVVESSTFTLKVTLGSPANINSVPPTPETPNSVNPQDLVKYINRASRLVYASFGPTVPGQPAAFLPIQVAGGGSQASPITGPPGFNGYSLSVVSSGGGASGRNPVQISQIFSGARAYPVTGATTLRPVNTSTGSLVPFYGSISHGLDCMVSTSQVLSADQTTSLPRTGGSVMSGRFGGNGLGSLVGSQFSWAFQGSAAIPSTAPAGSIMRADDSVFYTFNVPANAVMDSLSASLISPVGGQYFIDATADPLNPIYGVITFPSFMLNGNLYSVNITTTLADGVTSRYSLVVGGKSYPFNAGNKQVQVDTTVFTFNPINSGFYSVGYAAADAPIESQAPSIISLTPFSITAGGKTLAVDVFTTSGLTNVHLGVIGHLYTYDPIHATVAIVQGSTTTVVSLQSGVTYASPSGYGYVIGYSNGSYTVNGSALYPYPAQTTGDPTSHPLMTTPKMFTMGSNFYCFDQNQFGTYVSVTGNGQTYLVNPYQFSINGVVYVINTNVQPNTVVGGGNVYQMTALNTQFLLNGIQYTILLRQNSLYGASVSGQFDITEGNVVVLENYVYQLDTLNGQIVGNGTVYPLAMSGLSYTITAADHSFTVTTKPNAATVTINNVVYQVNNTTVVGDGITYPVLQYRSFLDGGTTYNVGLDGTVSAGPLISLTGSTFTDGNSYTVNALAASDGNSNYYLMTGATTNQFSPSSGLTYTVRSDGVAIDAGAAKTYILSTQLNTGQVSFGSVNITYGPTPDLAVFDGQSYYAISNNEFTTATNDVFTISGNTAIHQGNSYELFGNFSQQPFYFQVPGSATYFVNIPVADTGSANGDMFSVFPITSGAFTVPVKYSFTVTGSNVTVSSITFSPPPTQPTSSSPPTALPQPVSSPHPAQVPLTTLVAAGGSLTGGFFVDPVTGITYNCANQAGQITFTDSNNAVFPYSNGNFIASVNVTTGVSLAVDNQTPQSTFPITNNQFTSATATYSLNLSVAYKTAIGPYWPIVNGRFVVPETDPVSDKVYIVRGSSVQKGYMLSEDDQFSIDGITVYTISAVNVVKTLKLTVTGSAPNEVLAAGTATYNLGVQSLASVWATTQPANLLFDSFNSQFILPYGGSAITYSVGTFVVLDDTGNDLGFEPTVTGNQVTFLDDNLNLLFTFDSSGNNQITVGFPYTNNFFEDGLTGVTYYIDDVDKVAQAMSYIPETIQYGFVPANGQRCYIHYNKVQVQFPVISGANVNAGVATVGSDQFSVLIDGVKFDGDAPEVSANRCSFEINGNLYTIVGTNTGSNYSACHVVGHGQSFKNLSATNTFVLNDPNVSYSLALDSSNNPISISASLLVKPSRALISINDNVYIITYSSVSSGNLQGQGQASIPFSGSSFTLRSPTDPLAARYVFSDLNIYDAASVIGKFTVYYSPTFIMGSNNYTLNTSTLVVTDSSKHQYPLVANPTMFSINGFNYLVDTNQTPHAIVGNNNISPISTDVTVQNGVVVPNSTFVLNGLQYKYTEDPLHNLLTVTALQSYSINSMTFKLDSSLVFTLSVTAPAAGHGGFVGAVTPIGTVSAGTLPLNIYPGTPESGGADFFSYKGIMYTMLKSSGTYLAVQKSFTVFTSKPTNGQQQLAVFNLLGTTYIVNSGSTAGDPSPTGVNPGTLWSATTTGTTETQFGQIYGLASQPTAITEAARPATSSGAAPPALYQFQVTDAKGVTTTYDIIYVSGANTNSIRVDTPSTFPSFSQSWSFGSPVPSIPLKFETGGYDAFSVSVNETPTPAESYSMAYTTPLVSNDNTINTLMSTEGDFSVEFWHSEPTTLPKFYKPFTYSSATQAPLVYYVDVGFEHLSATNTALEQHNVYARVNEVCMKATTIPPLLTSRWRHLALTYSQPYAMQCSGAGFEVKDGTNYNFSREFSIGITFQAGDVNTKQGLIYKGAASRTNSPDASFSYMVTIEGNIVKLYVTTADGTILPCNGPTINAGQLYELFISKQTVLPSGSAEEPYAPPFNAADLQAINQNGVSVVNSTKPDTATSGTSGTVTSSQGTTTMSSVAFVAPENGISNFLTLSANQSASKAFQVVVAVRPVKSDGTVKDWIPASPIRPQLFGDLDDTGLLVNDTGASHLVIGSAFDANGTELPLGSAASPGIIRQVYLFSAPNSYQGIKTAAGYVSISQASISNLLGAGLVGHWAAQYDPNGFVTSALDKSAVATSTDPKAALLAPLTGHEYEGTSLYLNGYSMPLKLLTSNVPPQMPIYTPGTPQLRFNAGTYRLSEISLWGMCRQNSQILSDMFGRIYTPNEPTLRLYLPGSSPTDLLSSDAGPPLPLRSKIDFTPVTNPIKLFPLDFGLVSLALGGCPAIGRCGPLISPNLYTPAGIALTVCNTVPCMTTYSVTLNNTTSTLAGQILEAYVYVQNKAIILYAGKKVGDLTLSWVSQEQSNPQVVGYIEGPPPAPMANLTNRSNYTGATAVTLNRPSSINMRYDVSNGSTNSSKTAIDVGIGGGRVGVHLEGAPLGFGLDLKAVSISFQESLTFTSNTDNDSVTETSANNKVDDQSRYIVKLQGNPSIVAGDLFMANLNTLITPSSTGSFSSRTAILPNPNLGGFTTSNLPAQLPRSAPTDEKNGSRMFRPSPYGQAFVSSQTVDVYQQTLVQTGTVYGFIPIPNTQIPRDVNVLSFRMSSKYIRPGCLDGVVGYGYKPATLPSGAQTYTTSTGEMETISDKNFSSGSVGHDASYMRIVEAYQLKKQIDQQALNALAIIQSAYFGQSLSPSDPSLSPSLDFYNEYVWSSRGGTQEVKHTYTTSYNEVLSQSNVSTNMQTFAFNIKLSAAGISILDGGINNTTTQKSSTKYSYNSSSTSSFDITSSFDGIDSDTQMRYSSANDAHFVMKNNSAFNTVNQSGLNLIIGSDGLVYNIVPSVSSGAGIQVSDDIDDTNDYTQPQPAYSAGNASGVTGALQPYDRPGKTKQFRSYSYFLQPNTQNDEDFWNTVVDPLWLANSSDPDAIALQSAKNSGSIPWRLLHRVTYSERFLPPLSTDAIVVPQISPIMAVPVTNSAADFLFKNASAPVAGASALNASNDIEANVVLVAPTSSGLSAGTVPKAANGTAVLVGQSVLPNNIIAFDLATNSNSTLSWGDSINRNRLSRLILSVLGNNIVSMSQRAPAGSTKIVDILDPVRGNALYSQYLDPNGNLANVSTNPAITVYQDVNSNPIQYFDGKSYHSLQADYNATADGTITYYIQPPSTYDQTKFDILGDYDLFGHPGDAWRYFLVSGISSNMSANATFANSSPFIAGPGFTGFTIASTHADASLKKLVKGYVLAKGSLQWPHLNTNAEVSADVLIYKSMSLLDTFPIGDAEVLVAFLNAQYPNAPFLRLATTGDMTSPSSDIPELFAKNIISYFNSLQQSLIPK